MSEETLRFDIVGRDEASDAFTRVGDAAAGMSAKMDIAAVNAKILDAALRRQVTAANVSRDAVASLARADRILADAEGELARSAAAADVALRRRSALSGGAGGILGLLGGGAQGAAGAGPLAGLLPSGAVLGGVAAALAAITSGAAGIVPALAAATLGVGAFGALAIPTFTAVTGAVSALARDTAAYDAATTKAAKSTALARIKADWAALDPAQKQAVQGIQALQASFSALAVKLEPITLKVLNAGLKAASDLLPALLPLAKAAGTAIAGLLTGFDKFAQSPGFKAFIANMAALAGPAITAIGTGFGKIAVALGKLLIAMESPDALRILNGLFTVLAGAINAVTWVFTRATPAWVAAFHVIAVAFDGMKLAARGTASAVATAWNNLKGVFTTVGNSIILAVKGIVDAWLNAVGWIINGAAKAFGWLPLIGGKLKTAAAEFNTFAAQVNAALNSILDKTVHVTVVTTNVGAGTGGIRAHAAAGLYIAAGTGPTADDVLIAASRGELVVPARMVAAGLVDHLRGRIPGFAGGGTVMPSSSGGAGPDPVVAELRALRSAVERLTGVAGAIPRRTGEHVAAAVNGGAAAAAFRVRYP